jgi:hypothetical protein
VLTDDPVTDFMVMEAVSIKAARDDKKAQEKKVRDDWKDTKNKDNFSKLNQFR